MDGEVSIDTAQTHNEVILKSANGMFSGIALMHMWGNQLIINALFDHEVLQNLGAFIVKTLEFWFQSSCTETFVHNLVGCQNAVGCFVFHGLCMDAVGIIIIHA